MRCGCFGMEGHILLTTYSNTALPRLVLMLLAGYVFLVRVNVYFSHAPLPNVEFSHDLRDI